MDSVAYPRMRNWRERRGNPAAKKSQLHNSYCGHVDGQLGLTGAPERVHTHTVTPPTTANPPITAGVELIIPPVPAVTAPAPFRRFFFFFSVSAVSSRVVSCPWVTVVVPLSSCTVTSPLLAAICTRPSTSVT